VSEISRGRIVLVTGTTTGVGKTIATAALGVREVAAGRQVIVVKPAQTGIATGDSDADEVHRLSGIGTQEYTGLDEPLAPDTAARRAGITIPPVQEYADRIRVLAEFYDTVIVEGAGGLLVRLDTDGGTLRDLAAELAATHRVETLNHTELTVEALRAHALQPAGLILGSYPEAPDLAEEVNRAELVRVTGVPMAAVIPAGAGLLDPEAFQAAAPGWFTSH
jgi:dethiobiotin synthase